MRLVARFWLGSSQKIPDRVNQTVISYKKELINRKEGKGEGKCYLQRGDFPNNDPRLDRQTFSEADVFVM